MHYIYATLLSGSNGRLHGYAMIHQHPDGQAFYTGFSQENAAEDALFKAYGLGVVPNHQALLNSLARDTAAIVEAAKGSDLLFIGLKGAEGEIFSHAHPDFFSRCHEIQHFDHAMALAGYNPPTDETADAGRVGCTPIFSDGLLGYAQRLGAIHQAALANDPRLDHLRRVPSTSPPTPHLGLQGKSGT